MYFTFSCYLFIFDFFFKTFFIALLFLHLDIEAFKLFDVIISNFGLTMKEVLDMISLFSYIQQWRLAVWETCFFQKFKPKDAVLQKHGFYAPSKVITMIVKSFHEAKRMNLGVKHTLTNGGECKGWSLMIPKCTLTLGITLMQELQMFKTLVGKANKHQIGPP
jgi:hypothetical protein